MTSIPNPINPEAIPISKGWFSMDRANTSYAIASTIILALARTYAVSNELKVKDPLNLALLPVFIMREKMDDELFKRTQQRHLGDVACGVIAFGTARMYMEMSSSNALKYGALATAASILSRYVLEDNNLLKI